MEFVHSCGREDEQEARPSTQSHLNVLLGCGICHICLSPLSKAGHTATPSITGVGGCLPLLQEAKGREV